MKHLIGKKHERQIIDDERVDVLSAATAFENDAAPVGDEKGHKLADKVTTKVESKVRNHDRTVVPWVFRSHRTSHSEANQIESNQTDQHIGRYLCEHQGFGALMAIVAPKLVQIVEDGRRRGHGEDESGLVWVDQDEVQLVWLVVSKKRKTTLATYFLPKVLQCRRLPINKLMPRKRQPKFGQGGRRVTVSRSVWRSSIN